MDKATEKLIFDEVTKLLTDGYEIDEIIEKCVSKYKTNHQTVLSKVKQMRDQFREQITDIIPFIANEHLQRYEYLYEKFKKLNRTDLINAVLKQKEELLSLHQDGLSFFIQNNLKSEIDGENTFYDMEKLTKEQKEDLVKLLEKCYIK